MSLAVRTAPSDSMSLAVRTAGDTRCLGQFVLLLGLPSRQFVLRISRIVVLLLIFVAMVLDYSWYCNN